MREFQEPPGTDPGFLSHAVLRGIGREHPRRDLQRVTVRINDGNRSVADTRYTLDFEFEPVVRMEGVVYRDSRN